jgi:hypothetical protein
MARLASCRILEFTIWADRIERVRADLEIVWIFGVGWTRPHVASDACAGSVPFLSPILLKELIRRDLSESWVHWRYSTSAPCGEFGRHTDTAGVADELGDRIVWES